MARPAFLDAFTFSFYVPMELFLTCDDLFVIYYDIDIVEGSSGLGTSWDSQDGALIYYVLFITFCMSDIRCESFCSSVTLSRNDLPL